MGCEVSKEEEKKEKEQKKEKVENKKDYHWVTINPCFDNLNSFPKEISLTSLLDTDNFTENSKHNAILFNDYTIKVLYDNYTYNYIPKGDAANIWIYESLEHND